MPEDPFAGIRRVVGALTPGGGGGGGEPANPFAPDAPDRYVVDRSRDEIIGGQLYRYNRYGELISTERAYPDGGGGGGGARGATPEELALSYARLEQEQRQWEAEMLAAQAKGDADRAERAQNRLDDLAAQREELDRRYADSQAQREWQGRENEFDRDFQTARDQARYEFEGAEADKNRALDQFLQDDAQAFQGGENAADRSLRLQMQANDLGFSREELAFEKERFAATHELNKQRAGLAAARQFADVISSTDPAAYSAFMLAGGGDLAGANISNQLAGGGTALSENAMLPAAMTLRTAREMGAPVGAGLETQGLYGGGGGGVGLAAGGGVAAQRGGQRGMQAYPQAPARVPGVPASEPSQFDMYARQEQPMPNPNRIVLAQRGFQGVVNRPTMFLAGEGGQPESVRVQPQEQLMKIQPTIAESGAGAGAGPPAGSESVLGGRAVRSGVVPAGYTARQQLMAQRRAAPAPGTEAMPEDIEARRQQALERLRAIMQQAAGGYGGGEEFVYAGGPSPRFAQPGGEFQPGPFAGSPRNAGMIGYGGGGWPGVTGYAGGEQAYGQGLPSTIPAGAQQRGGPPPAGLAGWNQRPPWNWAAESPYGGDWGAPIFAQRGFQGVVNQPTPVVAGEGYRPENVSIQPLLQQYSPEMGEVRRLREGVQYGEIAPFDVKSRLIDPVLWERFLRGRQTKYGIPVRSQVHEINRYQLAGTRRGARQGY